MVIGTSHRSVPGLQKLARLLKEAHDEAKSFVIDHNTERKTVVRDKIALCIFELDCLPLNYKIKMEKIE